MSSKIISSPNPLGDHLFVVLDHTGPSSYTQVTAGATPSGGDSIGAQECGLKFIEGVWASGDDTGSYLPVPLAMLSPATSAIVGWWITSGMTQVAGAVNLSARHTRLIVWGR